MADANKMHSETTKAFKALTSVLEIRRAFTNTFANRTNEPKSSNEHRVLVLMEAHCNFFILVDSRRRDLSSTKRKFTTSMLCRFSRLKGSEDCHASMMMLTPWRGVKFQPRASILLSLKVDLSRLALVVSDTTFFEALSSKEQDLCDALSYSI